MHWCLPGSGFWRHAVAVSDTQLVQGFGETVPLPQPIQDALSASQMLQASKHLCQISAGSLNPLVKQTFLIIILYVLAD
jgi:hypothetical protein